MEERLSPLAGVRATREVLEAHGLATKHALGQNFLVNDAILRKIVDLAELGPQDRVLEVGPGIGTLTIALLKRAGAVASVECDRDLPAVLAQTCAPWADRFTLIEGDAVALSREEVPFAPTKLVSNLPYAVAATVVLGYFERFASLRQATVMVQAEVAQRMMARPCAKNYGAYTVKLGLLARPAGCFGVSPGNFFPPPHVQSTVIRLDRLQEPREEGLRSAIATMADAAFATRRKTIANSCRSYFGSAVSPEALACLLETAGIDPRRRGETLDFDEFERLGAAYRELRDSDLGRA